MSNSLPHDMSQPVRVAGGYEEGEIVSNGVPADWVVSLHGARFTKSIYMDIQFSSMGVDREEAERIISVMLEALNKQNNALE